MDDNYFKPIKFPPGSPGWAWQNILWTDFPEPPRELTPMERHNLELARERELFQAQAEAARLEELREAEERRAQDADRLLNGEPTNWSEELKWLRTKLTE
jgi:hypothetical protein